MTTDRAPAIDVARLIALKNAFADAERLQHRSPAANRFVSAMTVYRDYASRQSTGPVSVRSLTPEAISAEILAVRQSDVGTRLLARVFSSGIAFQVAAATNAPPPAQVIARRSLPALNLAQ